MERRVTDELLGYWNALRGPRPVPDRSEIDPGAIRACLGETFLLGIDFERGHRFRIAGSAICAMFGHELTRTPFDELWAADDRHLAAELVREAAENCAPAIADVTGHNADAEAADLELILLPLTCAEDGAGRMLGALTPVAPPYWLGSRAIETLHMTKQRQLAACRTWRRQGDLRVLSELRRV